MLWLFGYGKAWIHGGSGKDLYACVRALGKSCPSSCLASLWWQQPSDQAMDLRRDVRRGRSGPKGKNEMIVAKC